MIIGIVAALVLGLLWWVMASPTRNARRIQAGYARAQREDGQREIVSDEEYLQALRREARMARCPHPAYKGTRDTCGRNAGRPCVKGCTGRTNLSVNWHG